MAKNEVAADPFDLLIAGAGPAGGAAAIQAARAGLRVLVLERSDFPRPRPCLGWVGPEGVSLAQELGLTPDRCGAAPFRGLGVHALNFRKSAQVRDPDLSGWLVDRAVFDQALLETASQLGSVTHFRSAPRAIALGESRVEATLADGSRHVAGILLIGDGADSEVARLAGFRTPPNSTARAAYVEFPQAGDARIDVAIGASRSMQIATFVRAQGRGRFSFFTQDAQTPAETQFTQLCAAAAEAGLIPRELPPARWVAAPPAGAALDMDTHTGKRCLLIGDAGGFVASFSLEGVYPAMKSGVLAARCAAAALRSPVPQDELAGYSSAWRAELAGYLRMPNTDLALLMPLVFNNEQMTSRVARAFLLGQGF